jgi:hypothetical protein
MSPDTTDLEQQLRSTLARTAERVPAAPRPALSWERPAGASQVVTPLRRPSRTRRVLQFAAPLAVAAAVATVVVLPGSGDAAPTTPALTEVALLAPGSTVPMEPGQYLYSKTTYQATLKGDVSIMAVDEYWVPQDATDVWTYRGSAYDPVTGESVARYHDPATGDAIAEPRVETAPCGDYAHPEVTDCTGEGSWKIPTPRFIAELPTDPAELRAVLVEFGENWDRLARGTDEPEQFGSAYDEERSRLYRPMFAASSLADASVGLSQPFSQALEQAIAGLPGVVAEPATNLDGVPGTSYTAVMSDGSVVGGGLVFDADGNYIGSSTSAVVVGAADEALVAPAEG